MNRSPFAKLAPELRNRIYEYALHREQPLTITIYSGSEGFTQYKGSAQKHPLALARTCTVLSREATQLFYSINTFILKASSSSHACSQFLKWCDTIGAKNTAALRSVTLDIGTLYLDSFETLCAWITELSSLLSSIATMSSSGAYNCHFAAKALLKADQFNIRQSAVFGFVLDFRYLGSEWDRVLGEAEKSSREMGERQWKPVLFLLEKCREGMSDPSVSSGGDGMQATGMAFS